MCVHVCVCACVHVCVIIYQAYASKLLNGGGAKSMPDTVYSTMVLISELDDTPFNLKKSFK